MASSKTRTDQLNAEETKVRYDDSKELINHEEMREGEEGIASFEEEARGVLEIMNTVQRKTEDTITDEEKNVVEEDIKVTIEGVEYSVKETTELTIKGDVPPADLKKFVNLTYLEANSAKEIPKELVNLTYLEANSATEIPKEFVNLFVLSADSAIEIPKEFVNLNWLYANSATKIPKKLDKLTLLYANSATEIPKEFEKLESLATKAPFDKNDFPNLEEVWNYETKKWESVK